MYNNSVPGPEPDLNSGMAGLQMAMSTSSGKGTPATGTTPRAKPSVPQKKTHIEEMLRLRKEVEEMRDARDQAFGERDAMADDLLKAQEDFEEKDEALSKMSREVWTWREKAEKLSNDLADERRLLAQGRRALVEGNASHSGTREANGRNEAELTQQVQQLTAALAESKALLSAKTSAVSTPEIDQQASMQEAQRQFQAQLAQVEDRWRSQGVEQQKLLKAAEGSLHDTREYYENKLRDVELQARSHIEEQQRRLQEIEVSLQGRSQEMEVDSGGNEELERLRRLAAEQEGRINDQRQCAEQFKRMSERLTTQVKQANLAKRGLEQSEQAMRQQVEDMKSQVTASRRQSHKNNIPGSFQGYIDGR